LTAQIQPLNNNKNGFSAQQFTAQSTVNDIYHKRRKRKGANSRELAPIKANLLA
jgi:uncharacterized protein involved in high-affinity Fe2+ transport